MIIKLLLLLPALYIVLVVITRISGDFDNWEDVFEIALKLLIMIIVVILIAEFIVRKHPL